MTHRQVRDNRRPDAAVSVRPRWRLAPARRRRAVIGALSILVLTVASPARAEPRATDASPSDPLTHVLDETFRIRLTGHRLTLDYRPREGRIRGIAELRFRMRLGQQYAVFHFNPLRQLGPRAEQQMITAVRLDGRAIDPDDLRLIRPHPSAEVAFELPQRLAGDREHILRVAWDSPPPAAPRGWLYPDFDDTEGPDHETETMWPTVSSTEELVRHRIDLRVHGDDRYRVIGFGIVTRRRAAAYQRWTIDTRRPVSSSNVFFAAVPARGTRETTFRAAGVPVTILTDRSLQTTATARAITTHTIGQLTRELGPFPVPRMHILLTGWGSGMEYYGATRTGVGALRHELAHMYFATTAVNRTWRDTWIDEAVTTGWAGGRRVQPVPWDFRSHLASDRSVVAPGFNEAAYGKGVRVMSRIARALGGEHKMLAFLARVHHRRAFRPFTTEDFIADVTDAQDAISPADLRRWVFG